MKTSAFLFHDNLYWALIFHVTDLHKLSISSLHLFEGLPLDLLPSMGLQSVTWDVHLLSWRRAMWPAQVHFLALTTCMMSRTLVFLLIHSFVRWSCQDTPIIALSIFPSRFKTEKRSKLEAFVLMHAAATLCMLLSVGVTRWLSWYHFWLWSK